MLKSFWKPRGRVGKRTMFCEDVSWIIQDFIEKAKIFLKSGTF